MAYENHMPPLSTINQGTRDFDFIPLTELKEFDEKLNEIIKKISSINTSESSDVNSIAYKLKEIEYNLADAIEFDENGNVVSLKSTTSDKFGDDNGSGNTIIPDQGPASIDNLIINLEKYYNEFVKYLGNDVESTQWKDEFQKIFLNLKTSLDNKISSIFGNSAQASILEEKENDETDFMKQDSVKLNNNEIMRLNPNVTNYTRNINLMFERPGIELIAFEVECPEPDNMIFNMKLQNGDLYYNFNVILDNGKEKIDMEIASVKFFKNMVILKFKGIDDINDVEKYKKAELYVTRENAVPLKKDEYFIADLIGIEVTSDEGEALGVIDDVLQTGANDVYVIKKTGCQDLLVPAIKACIKEVDIENQKMIVHLLAGLRD